MSRQKIEVWDLVDVKDYPDEGYHLKVYGMVTEILPEGKRAIVKLGVLTTAPGDHSPCPGCGHPGRSLDLLSRVPECENCGHRYMREYEEVIPLEKLIYIQRSPIAPS